MKRQVQKLLLQRVGTLVLIISFVCSPLVSSAQYVGSIDTITLLQDTASSVESAIAQSDQITADQMVAMLEVVNKIQNDAALLQVLHSEGQGVTAEVIIASNKRTADVQAVTANGVEELTFYFDDTYADATDEELVSEALQRTAIKLGLNESLLRSGARTVSTFSGISAPSKRSVASSQAATTRRSDIEKVIISGNVPKFSAKATVVISQGEDRYGRELSPITKTYTYQYTPVDSTASYRDLMDELKSNVVLDLAKELKTYPLSVERNMLVTMTKFENDDQVERYAKNNINSQLELQGIADDFGVYSIIEDVDVVFGNDEGLRLIAQSDQNETLTLSIEKHYDERRGFEGKYDYVASFAIHDQLVGELVDDENSVYSLEIGATRALRGFGQVLGVLDREIAKDLIEFAVENNSVLNLRNTYGTRSARFQTCGETSKYQMIFDELVEFIGGGRQVEGTLADVTDMQVRIFYHHENNGDCYNNGEKYFRSVK